MYAVGIGVRFADWLVGLWQSDSRMISCRQRGSGVRLANGQRIYAIGIGVRLADQLPAYGGRGAD